MFWYDTSNLSSYKMLRIISLNSTTLIVKFWLSNNDFLNRKIGQFSLFLYLVILQHEICILYQPCTHQLTEALPRGTSPRER